MHIAIAKRRYPIAFLLAVVTVLGMFGGYFASELLRPYTTHPNSGASLVPFPKYVEDLVKDTDVILIGTLGQVVNRATFAGYDAAGTMKHANELNLPADAEIPVFDYEVRVERILKPHEAIDHDQPIILRMMMEGNASKDYSQWDYPPSLPSERRLFFLSLNPDGKTYGLKYGPASRIIIDGATVKRSDGKRSSVPEKETSSPAEFIGDVERIIRQQSGT